MATLTLMGLGKIVQINVKIKPSYGKSVPKNGNWCKNKPSYSVKFHAQNLAKQKSTALEFSQKLLANMLMKLKRKKAVIKKIYREKCISDEIEMFIIQ